jgi:hypothetical protein
MTNQHPITPSLERLEKWNNLSLSTEEIFVIAAQWGADQELEACAEWVGCMFHGHKTWSDELRAARRPKPPSLKEQALEALDMHFAAIGEGQCYQPAHKDTIRRALEALPND